MLLVLWTVVFTAVGYAIHGKIRGDQRNFFLILFDGFSWPMLVGALLYDAQAAMEDAEDARDGESEETPE